MTEIHNVGVDAITGHAWNKDHTGMSFFFDLQLFLPRLYYMLVTRNSNRTPEAPASKCLTAPKSPSRFTDRRLLFFDESTVA